MNIETSKHVSGICGTVHLFQEVLSKGERRGTSRRKSLAHQHVLLSCLTNMVVTEGLDTLQSEMATINMACIGIIRS